MNKVTFKKWLKEHHYPQLVLSRVDVIKHDEWERVLENDPRRFTQAQKRVSAFLKQERRREGNTTPSST